MNSVFKPSSYLGAFSAPGNFHKWYFPNDEPISIEDMTHIGKLLMAETFDKTKFENLTEGRFNKKHMHLELGNKFPSIRPLLVPRIGSYDRTYITYSTI